MLLDHDEPTNYEEAMVSPDSAKWLEAMRSEIRYMYENLKEEWPREGVEGAGDVELQEYAFLLPSINFPRHLPNQKIVVVYIPPDNEGRLVSRNNFFHTRTHSVH